MKEDALFLGLAYAEAAKSPDPSNQNGAVLRVALNDCPRYLGNVVSDCNRFPDGYLYDPTHLYDRDKRLRYIEHAERNVIFKAAGRGLPTRGAVMYCPWFACMECARAIILSGVGTVVGHTARMAMTSESWKASVEESLVYLSDCGIKVRMYDGPIGSPPVRVNGESWQP